MKKLVIVALSAVLAVMAVEPAHAQDQKVLAIIDTAIDSSRPEFKDKIIYEACFTVNGSCLNKTSFEEGLGSANAPVWPANLGNTTYHGHYMTQAALAINPNIKIVFVRAADITAQGNSGNGPQLQAMILAIDWVSKNASKYSIDAVSISSAGISSNALAACSANTTTINAIALLNSQNIPTFAATGNNSTLRSIHPVGFPACIDKAVGVGALAALTKTPTVYNNFAAITNRGPGLDLVAPTDPTAVVPRAHSTSGATVFAASSYLKSSSTTFSDFASKLVNVLGYPYISK
jgi:hypothetical protein